LLARSLAAMDNEDFRKLLDKPRVVQEPPRVSELEQDQRREAKATEDNDGKPRAKPNRLDEIHAKYVDRAELRRKGVEDLGEDPLEMKGLDFGLLAKARAEKGQARGRGGGKGQGADSDSDSRGEMGEEDAANHERYALGKTTTTTTTSTSMTASGAGKQGRQLARAIEAALLEVTKDG